jgi:hypothetical protein
LAHVVDTAVGRVVLGLPVPALIEIIAGPPVFEIEGSTDASCEKEQKNGGKRMARTDRRNTLGREESEEGGF